MEDRVTQLERISSAHSQLLTQLQQQLADNQRDIDSLRGQIQENQYQLSQVVERQKQIYQQMDSLSSQTPAASSDGQPQASASAGGSDANTDYNEAVALVLEKNSTTRRSAHFKAS